MTSKKNSSGLRAKGKAVLVMPYEPELKRAEGESRLVIPDLVKEKVEIAGTRAVVIDIGADAWSDEPEPRAAIGDKVMLTRYAGVMIVGPADGKSYRMVNDRDIYCQIVEE